MERLQPSSSVLVIIDVQDRLLAAMPSGTRDAMVANIEHLLEGARLLDVPVLFTEQYPKGLGPTVDSLAKDGSEVFEKAEFDATQVPDFMKCLSKLGREQLVVTGMEAHVCVHQTVRGLRAEGFAVHVPFDATCSRDLENRRIAEGLWRASGATVTCAETVLFDWLGRAGGDAFKAISKRLR